MTTRCLAALVAALALAFAPGRAAADLVVNGGFETGDFTGWTLSGKTGDMSVQDYFTHSGNYAAELGPVDGLGYLSQTLANNAGDRLRLSFYLSNGDYPNEFQVSLGDALHFSLSDVPWLPDYVHLSFEVVVPTANAVLTFGFRNDPDYFYLDDVSVEKVTRTTPEPGSAVLLGLGALGLAGAGWRRRRSLRR